MTMRPNTRLIWCIVIIVGSALYAMLVAIKPETASALMLGYVGVLLTLLILNEVWRKS